MLCCPLVSFVLFSTVSIFSVLIIDKGVPESYIDVRSLDRSALAPVAAPLQASYTSQYTEE